MGDARRIEGADQKGHVGGNPLPSRNGLRPARIQKNTPASTSRPRVTGWLPDDHPRPSASSSVGAHRVVRR